MHNFAILRFRFLPIGTSFRYNGKWWIKIGSMQGMQTESEAVYKNKKCEYPRPNVIIEIEGSEYVAARYIMVHDRLLKQYDHKKVIEIIESTITP